MLICGIVAGVLGLGFCLFYCVGLVGCGYLVDCLLRLLAYVLCGCLRLLTIYWWWLDFLLVAAIAGLC